MSSLCLVITTIAAITTETRATMLSSFIIPLVHERDMLTASA